MPVDEFVEIDLEGFLAAETEPERETKTFDLNGEEAGNESSE